MEKVTFTNQYQMKVAGNLFIPLSPPPLLFITGDGAHSREFSEEAYRLAAEPKELFIVPGAGHVDLYDRVKLIPFEKLTSFFEKHL